MPNHKSQKTSARKIAANRRNAKKSTGPRHPRKARPACEIRQQNWVRSLFDNQVKLGEDPDDFASYLADLIDDWQPAGATEMTLVEDLTTLQWERRKIDRAQEGWLVQRITREEHKRARHARQLEDASTAATSRDEITALGLHRSPDCPAKFREMIKILDALLQSVKNRDFSISADGLFQQLYGKNPSWRVAQISSYFAAFVNGLVEVPEAPDFEEDDDEDDPTETESGAPPASIVSEDAGDNLAGAEGTGDDGTPLTEEDAPVADDGEPETYEDEPETEITEAEDHYRELYSLLLEEYNNTAADYQDFMRDHIQISRPLRDSLLAFTGPKSAQIIRHRNSVDRYIERKMKLLMVLQKERRAREARAPSPRQKSRRRLPAATCAACAIFFLLGMIFTRSESSTSAGFAMSPQVRVSRDLSGSTGVIPALDVAAHHMRPGQAPSARAHIGGKCRKKALQQPNVRDVFLHIESHQVDENKENAFKTKANLNTSELSVVRGQLSVGISHNPLAVYNGLQAAIGSRRPTENGRRTIENAPLNIDKRLMTSACDALETVTFTA